MNTSAKTIQIFLPDGNARSIRIAEITSRTVQAVQVPRSKVTEARDRNEVRGVGVYFLFGESEEGGKPMAYIGEAEDCYERLKQHHQGKDFWNSAVIITSKTSSFTKAHGRYLEWYSQNQAKEVGRYDLVNDTTPAKPYISEAVEADLIDNYETIRVLVSTLGFPILEFPIKKSEAKAEEPTREAMKVVEAMLNCEGPDAKAQGQAVEDGFVVLKGARCRAQLTPTAPFATKRLRAALLRDGTIVPESHDKAVYLLTQEYVFNSPSAASNFVLGRSSTGMREWKNDSGVPLGKLLGGIK